MDSLGMIDWSRNEVIGALTLIVTCLGILCALFAPQFRGWLAVARRGVQTAVVGTFVLLLTLMMGALHFISPAPAPVKNDAANQSDMARKDPSLGVTIDGQNPVLTPGADPSQTDPVQFGPQPCEQVSDLDLEGIADEILQNRHLDKLLSGQATVVDFLGMPPDSTFAEVRDNPVFELVRCRDALPWRVHDGTIEVHEVVLDTSPERGFQVEMDLANTVGRAVTIRWVKGQIFENPRPNAGTQNLAVANESFVITLESKQQIRIGINAYCINKEWPTPKQTAGRVTPFKLRSRSYQDQNELWEILEAPELHLPQDG